MSFDSLLNATAAILRNVPGAADAYGQPTKNWVIHIPITPCRQVYGKGREILVGAETIIIYDELFVGDIDVTTWDRVSIAGTLYDIVSVVDRTDYGTPHHKQCFLQRVE